MKQIRYERKKEKPNRLLLMLPLNPQPQGVDFQLPLEQIAEEADVARKPFTIIFGERKPLSCDFVRKTIQDEGPDAIVLYYNLPDTRSRLVVFLPAASQSRWIDLFQVELNKDIYEKYFDLPDAKDGSSLKRLGSRFKKRVSMISLVSGY